MRRRPPSSPLFPSTTLFRAMGRPDLVPAVWSSRDARSILLVGGAGSAAPPAAPSGAEEMGVGEKFMRIGEASVINSGQAIKNNWKSYAVLGTMGLIGGAMVATGVAAP